MKNNWVLFLCVIFLSCDRSSSKVYNYQEFLSKSDFSITLDQESDYNFYFFEEIELDGNNYLLRLNNANKCIYQYSLEDGQTIKKICYPSEAPTELDFIQGFTFVNMDSIYLYRRGNLTGITLINDKSEFLNSFNVIFDPNKKNDKINNHISIPKSPTYYHKRNLNFIKYPVFDTRNPDNINSDFVFSIEVDIVENTIEYNEKSTFPKSYQKKIWPVFNLGLSRIFDPVNEREIYSWDMLDSIEIRTKNGALIDKKYAGSKYSEPNLSLSNKLENKEEINSFVNSSIYYSLKHDPYSNLYYRFFRIPLGRELGDIPHYAFPSDGNDFSVIVMDKDFKILNEVVFPGKKYKLEQAFVSKNGIYLPKTNSFDTNLNEDEVLYDIYKLF